MCVIPWATRQWLLLEARPPYRSVEVTAVEATWQRLGFVGEAREASGSTEGSYLERDGRGGRGKGEGRRKEGETGDERKGKRKRGKKG